MNIIGLVLSFAYLFLVLTGALYLHKRFALSSSVTRKITHIAVSNWWFILYYMMDSLAIALIGPITFIIVNTLSYQFHLLPAMELQENRKNLGTIYFPVSLLLLILSGFTGIIPLYAGGIGILVLGYGDGLASLVGQKWGKRPIGYAGNRKTAAGTLTMFAVSAAMVFLLSLLWLPHLPSAGGLCILVTLTAAVAAAVELFTPWGIDNITVPVATAAVYTLVHPIVTGV
jgi:phytol kinase